MKYMYYPYYHPFAGLTNYVEVYEIVQDYGPKGLMFRFFGPEQKATEIYGKMELVDRNDYHIQKTWVFSED